MLRGNCVLDLVEELRVRQWARRNWVPVNLRDQRWHRVILEEMTERDRELDNAAGAPERIVPVAELSPKLPGPHYLQPHFTHADRVTADVDGSAEMYFG